MITALLLLGLFLALAAAAYWFSRSRSAVRAKLEKVSMRPKHKEE